VPAIQRYVAAETFEMGKRLLTFSLARPRYNAEAVVKAYELFAYGIIHYSINLFCKKGGNVLINRTLRHVRVTIVAVEKQ
jgi:hypothetical protein